MTIAILDNYHDTWDEYEFSGVFDQIVAYAAADPAVSVNPQVLKDIEVNGTRLAHVIDR